MQTITVDLSDSVELADNIRVTLTEINGDRISLGFEAPRSVHILRKELKKDEKLRKLHLSRNIR